MFSALSIAGARIAYRFKGRLRESSTRVHTTRSNVSQELGYLHIIIEINTRSKRIKFRTVADPDQELILEMDFCKLFNIDVRLGRVLCYANEGEWREVDNDEATDSKASFFAECVGISVP